MSNLTIIVIAFSLTLDTFAVCVTSGVAIQKLRMRHAFVIAAVFGAFQAVMPLIGWLAGRWTRASVAGFDHWIAFGLLAFVGAKMIYESRSQDLPDRPGNPLHIPVLVALAAATSVDALAVGVTLSFLDVSIVRPVAIIGAITFAVSFAGVYVGDVAGHLFEKRLEVAAGIVLIAIGLKILIQGLL